MVIPVGSPCITFLAAAVAVVSLGLPGCGVGIPACKILAAAIAVIPPVAMAATVCKVAAVAVPVMRAAVTKVIPAPIGFPLCEVRIRADGPLVMLVVATGPAAAMEPATLGAGPVGLPDRGARVLVGPLMVRGIPSAPGAYR